jgi:hypothetical protein
MEFTNLFPTLFRYIILIGLYVLAFYQFKNVSIQFLLVMVFFILNFFTLIFAGKDILSTSELSKNIYGISDTEYQNPFIKYFTVIIGLTIILFVCSLSIILSVFDYGKKKTNDYNSYNLTPVNKNLMEIFQISYQNYMVYLAIFIYFIIFAHTTGSMRTLMLNLACIILSVIILSTSVYCCMIAVKLLDNKKYKRQLYQ